MIDFATLGSAFGLVFDPYVLLVIALAAMFGLVVGAMPGLTATMATALLIPLTFFMDPVPAIGAIIACSAMAIFAGDLPAILLRIPGTPSSAAYTEDGYAMTRAGRPELALGIALVCSALGGLFGSVMLVAVSPWLAEFALNFTSYEYFWLALLGLSCAAVISTASPLKGFISLVIGVFLATIGGDVMSGYPRFSFGNVEVAGGIGIVPALIGMFAIPELIRTTANLGITPAVAVKRFGSIFRTLGGVLSRYRINMARGWLLGTVVGALPGAGAGMAAWVSMAVSKKFSREPEKFGTGHPEGLIEATSANNSALSGAWVPALVFGIPGDTITAIVIGVLMMKGITPGPMVFIHSADLLYALFIIFFLANIAMLIFGWMAIRWFRYILQVPQEFLTPAILLMCIVGAFAINNSMFGVVSMLGLGIVAYLMEENDIPVAPAILGLVLGRMVEENFIVSAIKGGGDLMVLFSRPISATLGVAVLAIWLVPVAFRLYRWGRGMAVAR